MANPFGNMYTDEEKASYRKFAHRTRDLTDAELFRVNNGLVSDQLTSEMKDIVAWEIKIREIELLKRNGIEMDKEFSYKNLSNEIRKGGDRLDHVDYRDPNEMIMSTNGSMVDVGQTQAKEQGYTSEMSDELLKRSLKLIDENPMLIRSGDPRIHNNRGGGINIMTKKLLVECDNGDVIEFNNQAIQEHFRKDYIKKMSEITGIDYTKYDLNQAAELYVGYETPINNTPEEMHKKYDSRYDIDANIDFTFDEDEYEDDD